MTLLYTFHPLADAKQDEIWHYTYQQWGMQQADKYFVHYGKHYVFFRRAAEHLPERIQVLTILHDSMDIPARVKEDLDALEQDWGDNFIHEDTNAVRYNQ